MNKHTQPFGFERQTREGAQTGTIRARTRADAERKIAAIFDDAKLTPAPSPQTRAPSIKAEDA